MIIPNDYAEAIAHLGLKKQLLIPNVVLIFQKL